MNILVALLWPQQQEHARCREWLDAHEQEGWASCAITQAGCVRILSSPAVWPNGPTPDELSERLAVRLASPYHDFWPCELPYAEAVRPFSGRLHGHRQITDAYLLGLAIHHGGVLVTLDRSIRALLPAGNPLLRHLVTLA